MLIRSFHIILYGVICGAVCALAQAPQPHPQTYTWKSVQIVGGGFVDGVIFHPSARGIRYARTDMGGAYRWDDAIHEWQPMLDWVPYEDLNLMGVESIAVDPDDAKRVYLACGTYTNSRTPNGAILRRRHRAGLGRLQFRRMERRGYGRRTAKVHLSRGIEVRRGRRSRDYLSVRA